MSALMLGLGLGLCSAPPVEDEAVLYFDGEAAAAVFEDEAYDFCQPEFEPRYVTRRTCALSQLDAHPDCPGLASACERLQPSEPSEASWGLGADVTRWILIAVFAFLLFDQARRLLRSVRRRSRLTESSDPTPTTRARADLPASTSPLVFEAAERALEEGDAKRALGLLQQGLQRHIQDEKILIFDPSLTHRDYLRQLRRHPELVAVYRPFARLANRMRFGDGQVDRGLLAELIGRCRRLVLLLVLSFATACGSGPRPPSFDSHEPNGLAGLVDMLEAWGYDVRRSVGEVDAELEYDLLIARTAPFVDYDGADGFSVYDRALYGWPMVLLDDAQKLSAMVEGPRRRPLGPSPSVEYELTEADTCGVNPRFFLEREQVILDVPFMAELGWRDEIEARDGRHRVELQSVPLAVRRVDGEQRSIANLYTMFHEDQSGYVDTCVIHLASSALASNESLTRPANRAFVLSLVAGLAPSGATIAVVDALGFAVDESAGQLHFERSPVLPVLLQLGLCLLLWYWARGMSFGVLRDPVTERRRAFVEHAEALGGHFSASGITGELHLVDTLARALSPHALEPRQLRETARRLRVSPQILDQALAATRGERWEGEPLEIAAVLSRLIDEGW